MSDRIEIEMTLSINPEDFVDLIKGSEYDEDYIVELFRDDFLNRYVDYDIELDIESYIKLDY